MSRTVKLGKTPIPEVSKEKTANAIKPQTIHFSETELNSYLIKASYPNLEPSPVLLRLHHKVILAALQANYEYKPQGRELTTLKEYYPDIPEHDLVDYIEVALDGIKQACITGLDADKRSSKSGENGGRSEKWKEVKVDISIE